MSLPGPARDPCPRATWRFPSQIGPPHPDRQRDPRSTDRLACASSPRRHQAIDRHPTPRARLSTRARRRCSPSQMIAHPACSAVSASRANGHRSAGAYPWAGLGRARTGWPCRQAVAGSPAPGRSTAIRGSRAGTCQRRSKIGPPGRRKIGPLSCWEFVHVVHGRGPRAARSAPSWADGGPPPRVGGSGGPT